jgi:hypothetical protein
MGVRDPFGIAAGASRRATCAQVGQRPVAHAICGLTETSMKESDSVISSRDRRTFNDAPIPCATSSQFARCLRPDMPSATTALGVDAASRLPQGLELGQKRGGLARQSEPKQLLELAGKDDDGNTGGEANRDSSAAQRCRIRPGRRSETGCRREPTPESRRRLRCRDLVRGSLPRRLTGAGRQSRP